MVLFFDTPHSIIAVHSTASPDKESIERLRWLFDSAQLLSETAVDGPFVGPRKEMVTPWSTNAVEITQNMGLQNIVRIEEFTRHSEKCAYDAMLQSEYARLDQEIFTISRKPEPIRLIENIAAYNSEEGLALSDDEVAYLEALSRKMGRHLTDSEIFGFSQVNSEHCRHKIFNGRFVIDGAEKPSSLFQLIKLTTSTNPNRVVSAYKDNCAFLQGPVIEQFAPASQDKPDVFSTTTIESVLSLKAETHNFPTTVEPFNGAATGTGGEIRDRLAGGKGSLPLAGTAVYMTAYPRFNKKRSWESKVEPRKWLYQSPDQILIKASNGASDFGNKFGQPLICGSCLTFEDRNGDTIRGYDKVIMLAGGIGFGRKKDSMKDIPEKGNIVVMLGGDNYRIGMGGGAVSSVATGEFANSIELNAVQRSNPEMQKRAANAIRALSEMPDNPIVSIHDHGAGGHLNCLSELVENAGGKIEIDKLPVGDPTLSDREIIGNESQERMGLVLREKDLDLLRNIAGRERAPMYEIGKVTGDMRFTFERKEGVEKPMDLMLEDMFGNPPKTIMLDETIQAQFAELQYEETRIPEYLEQVLQLEEVACKDWLTNKVDRSVTGKVAKQQCAGPLQLPLNNLGVSALDYRGVRGLATSVGHAPAAGLLSAARGSVLSIAEALTNVIWGPLEDGLRGVSLSANWMWPCKNSGEDARLYEAVQAASDFALALGINIPTGKDSLSMTQKYPDGSTVTAPGTVIISAAAEVTDIKKVVEPVLKEAPTSILLYVDLSKYTLQLGGSSFAQVMGTPGTEAPTVYDPAYFALAFDAIQVLIERGLLLAGHDISAGGMITTLLEMTFSNPVGGMDIDLSEFREPDMVKILFHQNPGVVIQVESNGGAVELLEKKGIGYVRIGKPVQDRRIRVFNIHREFEFDINAVRDLWYNTSFLFDQLQTSNNLAIKRYEHYKTQALKFDFPAAFSGKMTDMGVEVKREVKSGVRAAIIREKGINGDREMAWMMHLAGFDVVDVHMTDLINGRETLEDMHMIVFVGGFSNSDVLGSAKGWAGAFLYNPKAKKALDRFYAREDTLSLGVCNGCQVMVELGMLHRGSDARPKMEHNASSKFESAFLSVDILPNRSVMLQSLSGARLGIWVAHGEGRFHLPGQEEDYHIPMKYGYGEYPANPNGSDFDCAALCSADGRHLVMMPHLERALYPWNWAYYPPNRSDDEISPWIEAFVNAREWIKKRKI